MIDIAHIPDALKEGENWHLLDIDPDWVWCAYDDTDRVVGMLIAAPCHGLVFIWRVKMLPSAPPWAFGRLLRRFIRDIRRRKCLGYIALLDIVNQPAEQALSRIVFHAGGMGVSTATVFVGSANAKHVGGEGWESYSRP